MLLSDQLPPLHADIIAVRGHTAVSGHVTRVDVHGKYVTITLPAEDEVPPEIDLVVKDGWSWEHHTPRPVYELPVPALSPRQEAAVEVSAWHDFGATA